MTPYRDINDEEWQRIAPLLPELRPRSELRGRPLANTRSVLNGVLWVIQEGAGGCNPRQTERRHLVRHAAQIPVVPNLPSALQGVA
jgi:hypothetical protein